LNVALCISEFPSEIVEKDIKPEVEMYGYDQQTNPLVLHPIYIARNEKEKCLIESSVNSCRV
jgi:actin related protein 2/3 complex subunit 4